MCGVQAIHLTHTGPAHSTVYVRVLPPTTVSSTDPFFIRVMLWTFGVPLSAAQVMTMTGGSGLGCDGTACRET